MWRKSLGRISKKAANAFKGRQAEEAVYGEEPAKRGGVFSESDYSAALNWYSQLGEVKKYRKYLEQYVDQNFKKYSKAVKAAKDNDIPMTMCSIARMSLMNCKLPKSASEYLHNKIQTFTLQEKKVVEVVVSAPKANNLISDTEDVLDTFFISNYKNSPVDYFKLLISKEAKPSEVREVIQYYTPLLEELQEQSDHLTKKQKSNYISFVEKILDDSTSYITNNRQVKKLTRKPRKKKLKSAEQLSSRVKFKISDDKLKLTSVSPANIVGSTSVWLYNTKYKRMTYLVSETGMSVKGTTITGFDPKKSVCKTIRKPEQKLSELLNMGKVTMLKQFLALKTKGAVAKGRLNPDVLILKASK